MKITKLSGFLAIAISILMSTPTIAGKSDSTSFIPSSIEELAWRFFIEINLKNQDGQLTWESWLTQACLNNPDDCPSARLHRSELRVANHRDDPARTGGCSAMTTKASAKKNAPRLEQFVPDNLSDNPVFCEEVTVNPDEEAYARSRGLLSISGQMDYLKSGGIIDFPWSAIEVKADWVPASSFTDVIFNCDGSSTQIYTEEIEGVCYGLAGIHINSKMFPNWLWATFEPQYDKTNPNRCNPELYNSCLDSWGSIPAESTGQPTDVSPALQAMFNRAGPALDKAFQNYRLTGVQVEFNQPRHSNGVLGSSFVEFNAQVPPQQASCITCHSYAERSVTTGKTPPGGAPKGFPSVGPRPPLGSEYKSLDFSWFLGFGVPEK